MCFCVICALAFLMALYIFLTMPNRKKRGSPAYAMKLYAHRGLHAEGIPENSLSAFRAAAEAGYGMELDVQKSSDGVLVVFHDDTLKRMCGVEGRITEMTYRELKKCKLLNTEEHIPTFDEVLDAVGGRTPLLVEVKLGAGAPDHTKDVLERLSRYSGVYLIESFSPASMGVARKCAPEMIRGQLVGRLFLKQGAKLAAASLVLSSLLLNFISRPDFIAFDKSMGNGFVIRLMRRIYRVRTAVWTIRTPDEYKSFQDSTDIVIFEGFIPE